MKISKIKDYGNGLKLIDVDRFDDFRGYFLETFRKSDMGKIIGEEIVQANESYSNPHVMRGLHFQAPSHAMGKLVRTITGHMVDMVLDIRPDSPTYGHIFLVNMPERPNNVQWLWIPPGFAHGNMFLAPTRIEYFCTGEYNQHAEFCITPIGNGGLLDSENDAASIQIYNTFQSGNPTITVKDKEGMTLEQWSKMPQANGFGYEFR